FGMGLFRKIALEHCGHCDDRRLIELFQKSALIERVARLGQFPSGFPTGPNDRGVAEYLTEDFRSLPWLFALVLDRRTRDLLSGLDYSILNGLAFLDEHHRRRLVELIPIAVALGLLHLKPGSHRIQLFVALGAAVPEGRHPSDPDYDRKYFGDLAGY